MKPIPNDDGLKYQTEYEGISVYVFVKKDGECPTEVVVSVSAGVDKPIHEVRRLRLELSKLARLTNEWLANGLECGGLIRFLLAPPSKVSGIIGNALVATIERGEG